VYEDLKIQYYEEVVPELIKEFGYVCLEQVPKLLKISISRGLGNATKDSKAAVSLGLKEILEITGQKPKINKARKSVANFEIRKMMDVGVSVTLRSKKMYVFFKKLIHIILPQVRDFRGLLKTSFDGNGNFNLGIVEQTVFPEISYNEVTGIRGFNISIVTSAKTDAESYFLLKLFGMRFKAFK
jgi:large subunit ribosomal protein L5